jgi:hypothetical protein
MRLTHPAFAAVSFPTGQIISLEMGPSFSILDSAYRALIDVDNPGYLMLSAAHFSNLPNLIVS